ncbi:hypothetical protein [Dactylosporangium matsuzakiense]|uniref:Protein kinase domain-containing protein n=1 Tax=Dactylosporangium matsuzakiense TaxID=53360 RepID=A0A9W6KTI8_9ACTN|nr:hypothetical protein [Dactylosporangium matsuzakiense]UWZ47690.1 hypothetical protein Dmats_15560 [Dactylosporangium matsuzakiense]GLL07817.1 hypothetical protein GCM10017581_095750 [Dactylosporangium matsuzakiense]
MTVHIEFDADRRFTDQFELQWGRLAATGERVLRRTARNADAQRLVRAEVHAGRLLDALPGTTYPVQLCRVVEHDLTGASAHVTSTYRGVPVAGQPGAPLPETLLKIFGDLLVAIQTLAKAGLTHGAIVPEFVLWDGTHAQLVNLGEAVAVGEPARAALDPQWQPPAGPDGLRLATEADDVYQAGMVVFCIALQRGPAGPAQVREELGRGGGSALSALLEGVFADDPRDRPDAHELLRRVEEARYEPVWQSPDPADATTATIKIPQQYSPVPATMPVPVSGPPTARAAVALSPARDEFRRLVEAKQQYRQARNAPQRVAWRWCRSLVDVLWYSRDELSSKIIMGVLALVVIGVPLTLIVLIVGGSK